MRTAALAAALLLSAVSAPAFAEGGGDREPAGGAFMSSYLRSSQPGAPQNLGGFNTRAAPEARDVVATGSIHRRTRAAR